jgi:hypothetical protein
MDELKDLLGNKNKEEAKKSDQIPSTKSQTKPKSQ